MKDYLEVTYKDKPYTNYPFYLAHYLMQRFKMKSRQKILDVGCGRGEYLKGFSTLGLSGYGIDKSINIAKGQLSMNSFFPLAKELKYADLDFCGLLPWKEQIFDWVFTKSVIEHLYRPDCLLEECYRVLKEGGGIIVMTPDFKKGGLSFWGDYTHRTPFVKSSLYEALEIAGFEDIKVERFLQVPLLWKKPWLKSFLQLIAYIMPWIKNTTIKFSTAYMLLGTGRKII